MHGGWLIGKFAAALRRLPHPARATIAMQTLQMRIIII